MKQTILIICLLILLAGCEKNNEPKISHGENLQYTIDYADGETYTQTFYTSGAKGVLSLPYSFYRCFFNSICNRVRFELDSRYDDNFQALIPSEEMQSEMNQLNEEAKGMELQYYMVAKIKFTYPVISMKNIELLSDWEIVIGRMEEYVYKGKIYKHLVIIDSYEPTETVL